MSEPGSEGDSAYGTAPLDAPVCRADFERAVRGLNIAHLDLRDTVLQLAARVVTLTDELTRRLDGVEPVPAAPGTPAAPPRTTIEAAVDEGVGATLAAIKANDARGLGRVALDDGDSKYDAESPAIPCAELIPLCHARCCALTFALSTQDLDEGVIRWDYGQPYLIRQRASDGYCVHNHPEQRGCTAHPFRPRVCRVYDCRNDSRVWIDYEQRIAAPLPDHAHATTPGTPATPPTMFDLLERAKLRSAAVDREQLAINHSFADTAPHKGPKPT
jgi:Fe-S-cluster containining protein